MTSPVAGATQSPEQMVIWCMRKGVCVLRERAARPQRVTWATHVDDVVGLEGAVLLARAALDLLLHLLFSDSSGDERGHVRGCVFVDEGIKCFLWQSQTTEALWGNRKLPLRLNRKRDKKRRRDVWYYDFWPYVLLISVYTLFIAERFVLPRAN